MCAVIVSMSRIQQMISSPALSKFSPFPGSGVVFAGPNSTWYCTWCQFFFWRLLERRLTRAWWGRGNCGGTCHPTCRRLQVELPPLHSLWRPLPVPISSGSAPSCPVDRYPWPVLFSSPFSSVRLFFMASPSNTHRRREDIANATRAGIRIMHWRSSRCTCLAVNLS